MPSSKGTCSDWRLRPPEHILYHEDFDLGFQGRTGLIGNRADNRRSMLPAYRDLPPPMLSNAST